MNVKLVRNGEGQKHIVLGDNQTWKLTGEDTNNQFLLIEQHDPPGVGIPKHIHQNEDEVFHVLKGKVQVTVDDQTSILESGDVIFCPRGVSHSWEVVGNGKAKTLLSIFPAGLEKLFKELAELQPDHIDFGLIKDISSKYSIEFLGDQ